MSQRSPEQELEEVRLSIGANDGEPLIDAIHRYTFAVQLGCARKLEQYAERMGLDWRMDKRRVINVLDDLTGVLRADIPTAIFGDGAQPDAIERWRAEQLDALKAGILEHVFPQFWHEALGDIPSQQAKDRLRELLEAY